LTGGTAELKLVLFVGREKDNPMPECAVDLHIGKRLRRRRRLLGLTQKALAESIGIRFQQIQKYECAGNRVTASRLYELAVALDVSVNYFYQGYESVAQPTLVANDSFPTDALSPEETIDFLRRCCRLPEMRRRILALLRESEEEAASAA
jgi:transcriptional regulator with XRE-family HTH domain